MAGFELCAARAVKTSMTADKKYEITITTRTTYVPEQSDAGQDRYVFAYTITLKNTGNIAAQLISRHWIITDADSKSQEVRGLGVVGEQPKLRPDESFEYTSGTAITMHSSRAAPVRIIVLTKRGTMMSVTGALTVKDRPRSPCAVWRR